MDSSAHLEELRHALQQHVPAEEENLGVITGYIVVAQWSSADGEEWLTWTAGTINDEPPTVWSVKGWLRHALDKVRSNNEAADE